MLPSTAQIRFKLIFYSCGRAARGKSLILFGLRGDFRESVVPRSCGFLLTWNVHAPIMCAPRMSRRDGMYFRKKTSSGRAYLQIVESRRQGAQVRQQVIATLGRVEELRESGQLERLLRSGARFAAKAIVVDAVADGAVTASAARRIGPALVFERLWEETGCRRVVEDLAGSRKHGFPLERAVFLTVLHRLFSGGSDRGADRWREDYRIDGVENLELHHLYRAMAWLGKELAEDQQHGATPFAPRCLKESSRRNCSRGSAICSARSISCSWTRPASISRERADRPSDNAAFPRIIGRISIR